MVPRRALHQHHMGAVDGDAMTHPKQIQLTFHEDAVEAVERLKVAMGTKETGEVIREALGLLDWARAQVEEGYVVGAMTDEVMIKEVLTPFVKGGRKPIPTLALLRPPKVMR